MRCRAPTGACRRSAALTSCRNSFSEKPRMKRPIRSIRTIAAAALLASACAMPLSPATAQQSAPDRAAIEQIIKDYLMAHPEVLMESLNEFQKKQEAAE